MNIQDSITIPDFPNSAIENLIVTSLPTTTYNCIAWAYGCDDKWYWPDKFGFKFWPNTIPREATSDAFIQLFEEIGYRQCDDDSCEDGYEKVAIYLDASGIPTHAARQLDTGRWTSKLGEFADVEHSIFSIDGGYYGKAAIFMKRTKVV